jgi:hypothetical protein
MAEHMEAMQGRHTGRRGACRTLLLLALCAAAACRAQSPDPVEVAELWLINDSGRTLIPSDQAITDNGQKLVSLPRQTYTVRPLALGRHVLRPEPPLWKQEVELEAVAGRRYYVVIAYRPERSWARPFAGVPLILRELPEAQATDLIRDMQPR